MNLSHSFYQLITLLLSPFLKAIILWRAMLGKEDKTRLQERWGLPSHAKRQSGLLYWVHAVSVGEANSALVLVQLLKELQPTALVVMTTSTVASAELMAKKLPEGAIHQYFPIDNPFAVRSFLDFWEPQLALWVESELWPNHIIELSRRNIPLLLMNGRISERSSRRWLQVPWFIKPLLASFHWCGVQTADDLKSFQKLGAKRVEVMPNLKLLTSPPSFDEKEYGRLKKQLDGRFIWFASCTHPEEEERILKAHQVVQRDDPNALLFLAPRHLTRVEDVKTTVRSYGFTYSYRSKEPLPQEGDAVHIIDTMGELGLFYALSPSTFVGGTWALKGGHNPIEAAQMGSYVLHGESISKNRLLYEALQGMGLAEQVASPEELSQKVKRSLSENRNMLDALRVSGLDDIRELLSHYTTMKEKRAC